MSYDVLNLRIEEPRRDVGGYRIIQLPNYAIAANSFYRAATLVGGHTVAMKYGCHVRTAGVDWPRPDPEPVSRFLNDPGYPAPGVHDLIILNNLLAREKACLEGEQERYWHVTPPGPTVTISPDVQKWPFIETALSRIRSLLPGQDGPRLRSILWMMESWNSTALDVRVILLRDSFELLWANQKAEVVAQAERISAWLKARVPGGPPMMNPLQVLVIGRHTRNYCVHNGGFTCGQTDRIGNTADVIIIKEMNDPLDKWKDGHPSVTPLFKAAVAATDLPTVLVSSIQFLDYLLYCLAVDWLGISLDCITGVVDHMARYLTKLTWPARSSP